MIMYDFFSSHIVFFRHFHSKIVSRFKVLHPTMFSSFKSSPVVSRALRTQFAMQRLQSSTAGALASMKGRHFLSIDELRYVVLNI